MSKFLFKKHMMYMTIALAFLGGMGNAVAAQNLNDTTVVAQDAVQPTVLADKLNGFNGFLQNNAEVKILQFYGGPWAECDVQGDASGKLAARGCL